MALHSLPCSTSALWVLTAAFVLLSVPTSYILPNKSQDAIAVIDGAVNLDIASPENSYTVEFLQSYYQSADLLPHIIMLVIGFIVYLFEWIHRKLMERRILKLRSFLGASLERLREADARREQLEGTLKLARGASAEYNLLLFLLLRAKDGDYDKLQC
ncbi:uncharacterized protein LOC125234717 [Leguminivora glycinivorella]|uniref:uncharacterized protein LOC125234717 n=1 Tax=Leguminivora glycinivorella TaxID=1035111 RepID=UPI00200DDEB3|nr:uncharacterized protein LOC125234717 [Leguminivora glycinivorella]